MSGSNRILGTLRASGGTGVVRMEDRFDTSIEDLWAALTDPARLARWYAVVEGDLRVGGEYRARVHASEWEGAGQIEACEPPRYLRVSEKEDSDEEAQVTEATLTTDGDQTILVIEQRGMPLEALSGYGAGIQIHVEDLGAHIAGRDRCDASVRWPELEGDYEKLAAAARAG